MPKYKNKNPSQTQRNESGSSEPDIVLGIRDTTCTSKLGGYKLPKSESPIHARGHSSGASEWGDPNAWNPQGENEWGHGSWKATKGIPEFKSYTLEEWCQAWDEVDAASAREEEKRKEEAKAIKLEVARQKRGEYLAGRKIWRFIERVKRESEKNQVLQKKKDAETAAVAEARAIIEEAEKRYAS